MKHLVILLSIFSFLSYHYPINGDFEKTINQVISSNTHSLEDNNQKGYKVIRVKDGDTFVLLIDSVQRVVRFSNIDCPEKKQPFSNRAKQFVADRCFGKYVTLINDNKSDNYGRLLAEVILENGENLNKELVRNGLAWHFTRYSSDEEYAQLEIEARNNRIGIWSDPSPTPPWDWRKPRSR